MTLTSTGTKIGGAFVITLVIAVASCSASVVEVLANGGGGAGSSGISVDDASSSHVPDGGDDVLDSGLWTFDGHDPPLPGQFPPANGEPCVFAGHCGDFYICNEPSGWCCSGQFVQWDYGYVCACGNTLGCIPPAVCCGYPGEFIPRCAPTADQCPTL